MATNAHYQKLREHYLDQPNEIALETLALCNAACSFCPYPVVERKGVKMPDEMIDRLVKEMATFEKPFLFSPFKLNEPLLDKRLIPLCERMNRDVPLARLRIFTNGSALTPDKIEGVAGLKNVVHLWISLNSIDPVKYEELMQLKFAQTTKRLDYLHSIEFPHPVMLSTVGYPDETFRRYCFERWPKFESFAIMRTSWLGFTDGQITKIPDTPCARWWELSITSQGIVSLCCQDSEGQFPIGDLNKQTLLEVYNSPAWRERREKLLSRRGIEICQTCTYAMLLAVPFLGQLISSLTPIA